MNHSTTHDVTAVIAAPARIATTEFVKPCACPSSQTARHAIPGERVVIGARLAEVSTPRQILALIAIYLPILFIPFVLLSAMCTYLHLWLRGAQNLRSLWSFAPSRQSHRYSMKTQILPNNTLQVDLLSR